MHLWRLGGEKAFSRSSPLSGRASPSTRARNEPDVAMPSSPLSPSPSYVRTKATPLRHKRATNHTHKVCKRVHLLPEHACAARPSGDLAVKDVEPESERRVEEAHPEVVLGLGRVGQEPSA